MKKVEQNIPHSHQLDYQFDYQQANAHPHKVAYLHALNNINVGLQ